MSGNVVEIVCDGDGFAVIGTPAAVDAVMESAGLPAVDLKLPNTAQTLNQLGTAANVTSELISNSGRWVKLTKESAKAFHAEKLMTGSSVGVSRAVTMKDGKISGILEIASGSGSALLGPAGLPIIAGIMAQQAMQQSFDEILDYLAVIDEKVDDIIRAQHDAVLSELIAVGRTIEESMLIREEVGRMSDITWSKIQANSKSIANTQDAALRALNALADKLDRKAKVSDLADAAAQVEAKAGEWLLVLARTIQLDEAMSILELDRVLASAPEDLDAHRRGLQVARTRRMEMIVEATDHLLDRVHGISDRANQHVLLHPKLAAQVNRSVSRIVNDLSVFRSRVGTELVAQPLESKAWRQAVGEVRDRVMDVGVSGVSAVKQFGEGTLDRALVRTESLAEGLAENIRSRRENKKIDRDEPESQD
ncbi:hypothetical protein [Glutamicibacter sp. X7]